MFVLQLNAPAEKRLKLDNLGDEIVSSYSSLPDELIDEEYESLNIPDPEEENITLALPPRYAVEKPAYNSLQLTPPEENDSPLRLENDSEGIEIVDNSLKLPNTLNDDRKEEEEEPLKLDPDPDDEVHLNSGITLNPNDAATPLVLEPELDSDAPLTLRNGLTLTLINKREILNSHLIIIEYQLSAPPQIVSLIDVMASFKTLLDNAVKNLHAQDDDQIQAVIWSDTTTAICTPCVPVKDFHVSFILSTVQKASISGNSLDLANNIRIDIKHFKTCNSVDGAGGVYKYKNSCTELYCNARRSIIQIKNLDDNMCMARAIIVGIAKQRVDLNPTSKNFKKLFESVRRNHGRCTIQYRKALELCNMANISPKKKCGYKEAQCFENILGLNIKIIARDLFNEFIYDGVKENPQSSDLPPIYLYRVLDEKNNYHFHTIGNVKAFFNAAYFCATCNVAYNQQRRHKCVDIENWCYACCDRACNYDETFIVRSECCNNCNVRYRSDNCKKAHEKSTECRKLYFCLTCYVSVKREIKSNGILETNDEIRKHHVCQKKCPVCKVSVDPLHRCYLQKGKYKPVSKKYLFLDFESEQTTNVHIPIFCHLKWYDEEYEITKNWCDLTVQSPWQEKSFGIGFNVTNDVGEFIFSQKFKHYTIIAHNMQGYDGSFLLRFLAERGIKPKVILKGRKIMSIIVPGFQIRIIDSFNFLPMGLAGFQKALGLKEEYKKGFFPHYFIREENFKHIGEMPPEKDYGTHTMNETTYKIFKKWYDEYSQSDYIFNFEKELKEYCIQDVETLQEGCWVFREMILNLTNQGCDPFQYLTLPQLCNAVYKVDHMPWNTIGAIPPGGYLDIQNYSSASLEWLNYIQSSQGKKISHVGNSPTGEAHIIGNIRVDGLDEDAKSVYEFYGCYYHGCKKCFPKRSALHSLYGYTFDQVYKNTKSRETRLRIMGYEIISIWECEWNSQKTNPDIQNFLLNHEGEFKPLNPHESFFGGRVEAFNLLVDDKKTKMNYADIVSLYPYVNATCKYPIGHPQFISNNFGPLNSLPTRLFGFIYCKILPPRNLYIPVLPFKFGKDKKLLFALCKCCASEEPRKSEYCSHSDEERCITGTWFSEEIKVAIQHGYKLIRVYSAYHFEKTSTSLFSSYIQTFYKLKLLASGKPLNTETSAKMNAYIKSVKENEFIDLTNCVFENNPGLRQVAKLMLNSLWGKFGTRRILTQHQFCSSIDDLKKLFNDDTIKACNVVEISNNIVLAMFEKKTEDFVSINNVNNIYVASCTTAWARIILYNHLSKLNTRAVYCDTDSVIYKSIPHNDLTTGEFLGQLKNELRPNEYIIRICCAAPKVYVFITGDITPEKEYIIYENCKNEHLRIKGFRLSATTQTAFNFHNLKEMVLEFCRGPNVGVETKSLIEQQTQLNEKRQQAYNQTHSQKSNEMTAHVDKECISIYNPSSIQTTATWRIVTIPEQKIFTCNYNKRMINSETYDTLPFGYCKQ